MQTKRIVISKSSKRKMTSEQNNKADSYTEMVIYITGTKKGNRTSVTHHEKRYNN